MKQARMNVTGRNINNFRYANDTTPMGKNVEELKSLLKRVKEESEKAGLKLNIQKTKFMASGPITLWQIDGETRSSERLYLGGGSKITAYDYSHEIKILVPWKKSYGQPRQHIKKQETLLCQQKSI